MLLEIGTLLIVSTDYLGNNPLAVYPDNMVQSARSRTAFVTSEISALEGLTLPSMDSNICVAVITGLPALRHLSIIYF